MLFRSHQRVERVTDFLKEGQIVRVKVLETDEKGRVKLSMKALLDRPAMPPREPQPYREPQAPREPQQPRDAQPQRELLPPAPVDSQE